MALCRDKSLTFLNDKGYNVVRVPRAGIEPLDLLGRDGGSMEWLGRLEALWQSPAPPPRALPPEPAADIEGKRTDSLEITAGLSLLKGVLSVFNAGAGLDAAYARASSLEFTFSNVRSIRVAPLDIGAYLATGKTDPDNPVVARYFLGDAAEGFILTEVLKSDELKVTARTSSGGRLDVDVDQISATLGAEGGVAVKRASESTLVYSGRAPVTFAFRLLRIDFEGGRWVTRGAKASGALSFDVAGEEAEPASLTSQELLDIAEPVRAERAVAIGYTLICFDADGVERPGDGGEASAILLTADPAPTDIFFNIHGWKGDVPAAIDQYDRWFGALQARDDDRARLAALRTDGFRPMLIGLHWPSLPFGDEEMPVGPSFAPPETGEIETLVDAYVERLGDRPGLRDPLRVIVAHAMGQASPAIMPEPVRAAYETLDALMEELGADGPTAPPGADNPPFDAPAIYDEARGPASFGFDPWGLLIVPLQQMSFWKMKERAKRVGEGGFHQLLGRLAKQYPQARLHVMGHSFGCIAASAAIAGPEGSPGNRVASLALVQGALSLWSYGSDNDYGSGRGYFERLVANDLVSGPIVATMSKFDRALSFLYPLGAAARWQIDFAPGDLPRFGAVGIHGAHGLAQAARDLAILDAGAAYTLEPGRIHNVESSRAIRKGGGMSGAHSDIDGPEVAHLIWSAAVAAG